MSTGANEYFFLAVVQHMPTDAGSGGKDRPLSPDKNLCLSLCNWPESSKTLQDNSL